MRGVLVWLTVLAVAAIAPAIAQAGASGSGLPTFPATVTVGQTVAGSIALRTLNTSPDTLSPNFVCNLGSANPPCFSPQRGIVLVPACGQIASFACAPAGADPGVFAISATATGRAGSACASIVFDTAIADAPTGAVRFTPQGGAAVLLPASLTAEAASLAPETTSSLIAPAFSTGVSCLARFGTLVFALLLVAGVALPLLLAAARFAADLFPVPLGSSIRSKSNASSSRWTWSSWWRLPSKSTPFD